MGKYLDIVRGKTLPPLRHDMAITAVLCAKNAWLSDDELRPQWRELNEPWNIAFGYDDELKTMNMALYIPADPLDPAQNAASSIHLDLGIVHAMHVDDVNYAERFATECVTTMEYGVRTTIGEPNVEKDSSETSRKLWPRMDPPMDVEI